MSSGCKDNAHPELPLSSRNLPPSGKRSAMTGEPSKRPVCGLSENVGVPKSPYASDDVWSQYYLDFSYPPSIDSLDGDSPQIVYELPHRKSTTSPRRVARQPLRKGGESDQKPLSPPHTGSSEKYKIPGIAPPEDYSIIRVPNKYVTGWDSLDSPLRGKQTRRATPGQITSSAHGRSPPSTNDQRAGSKPGGSTSSSDTMRKNRVQPLTSNSDSLLDILESDKTTVSAFNASRKQRLASGSRKAHMSSSDKDTLLMSKSNQPSPIVCVDGNVAVCSPRKGGSTGICPVIVDIEERKVVLMLGDDCTDTFQELP
ncbi:hypothetical protein BU17DRAFT_82194 [Hysterangium stoloniferum]|nr:hypothetical protein BU17DRAFT_82194 [Hysterangium stoloniferum]